MNQQKGAFVPTGSACREKAMVPFLDEQQSHHSSIREKAFAEISA